MKKLGAMTTYKDVEHLSVGDVLTRSASIVPDKVVISFKRERIRYRELESQASALAAGLQEIGITKGDRVAIYLPSLPQLHTTFFALQKIGAIVAWINAAYKTHERALS